ncbi:hypothetical protein [Spirillospora sp. NPDC048819]|uniref:hypothetical protein n=1 Tax=Spirillospora sp. NPDC048819 TaxID=3155268 RepID=UPI0033EADCB5
MTHSPDGESRGLVFQVGDISPPWTRAWTSRPRSTPATEAAPWGLRFLVQPRAGKHDMGTSGYTTGGQGDGQHPEDKGKDRP